MDPAVVTVEQPYDVIVLDRYTPAQLPRCRYLVFGRPPKSAIGPETAAAEQLTNQVVVDWRSEHSVLKYVNLMNLFAAKCYKLNLPRDAEVLAEFNQTPALAVVRRKGSVFLLAGFDILQTNWPFESSFILFCYNALNFLGTETAKSQAHNLQVGRPIIVEGLSPDTTAVVDGPGISDRQVNADSAGSIRLAGVDKVGVYSLKFPDEPVKLFAVNLLDSAESNIEPVRKIVLSDVPIESKKGPVSRANLPVWPFLVVLALVIAFLEWLIYNSKVRL